MTAPAFATGANDPEPAGARLLLRVSDARGPLGALVLDDVVAQRACGGLRIAAAVTEEELRELAAVMTLKFAFFGIACGGAKAGLVVPANATPEERQRRIRTFGAALGPLIRAGTYIPGTDLGCGERDLWEVVAGAGLPVGVPPGTGPVETSGTAAFSGRSAAIAAIAALGGGIEGATLAVLGYGRVGAALAGRFAAAGGRLVGVSTARGAAVHPVGFDVARLERLRARQGDDAPLDYPGAHAVDPHELLALGADVIAPCATVGMIDGTLARRVRCRVVSSGANAALTDDAETVLGGRGTIVVPDFVANAGGVLVSHFWPLQLPDSAIDALLERRFRAIVEDLLSRAARRATTPAALARKLARRNLARLRRDLPYAIRHERMLARLGRSRAYRVLPPVVVGALALRIASHLGPPAD